MFLGKIKNGEFKIDDRSKFLDYCKTRKDGDYILLLKRPSKIRSLQQNRYYWGLLVPMISEFVGEEHEVMHEILKYRFLKVFKGEEIIRIKSTTELTTVEFDKYCADIRRYFVKDFGLQIPEPNEAI